MAADSPLKLRELFGLLDEFTPEFEIVEPRKASVEQDAAERLSIEGCACADRTSRIAHAHLRPEYHGCRMIWD